jgi:hypothetical protein
MKAALEDGEMFSVSIVLEDSTESEEVPCLTAKEENYIWIKQKDDKRKCSRYQG